MAFSRTSDVFESAKFTSTAVASDTATLPTVNAGDLIYVWVTADSASNPTITVSDPTNGSYTAKLKVNDVSNQAVQQFYFVNSVALSNVVVTANFSPSRPFVGMYARAEGGVDTAVGFDVQNGQVQAAPGTGTDAIVSNTATTTAIDFILGVGSATGAGSFSEVAGTGFSSDASNATMHCLVENKTQSGSGSDQGTWTDATDGGSATYLSIFMAMAPVSGSATSNIRTNL